MILPFFQVTQCVACQASSVIIKKEVEYTPIQVNILGVFFPVNGLWHNT